MISAADRDKVLESIELEEVINTFLPGQLKKKGANLMMCCPFHNERTPSFSVSPARGIYKCFSCGKGGNAITFLTDHEGMSYPEAVKWIADRKGIEILGEDITLTEEQRAIERKREAMFNINAEAAKFYEEEIRKDYEKAKAALKYVEKRWGKELVKTEGIGFAPGRNSFRDHARELNLNEEILLEVGLLNKSKETGAIRDTYFDRIMIPIRDKYGRVTGFTARTLTDDVRKYINSCDSAAYTKSKLLFGLQNSWKQAAKEKKVYILEGAPDVLRLNSIGIFNAVAPLGTALTPEQIALLKRLAPNVCFIPDIDAVKNGERFGSGIKAVLKNGRSAFEAGLNVTVKEITETKPGEKTDPDSYITSKQILHAIEESDFVAWYARKVFNEFDNVAKKSAVIQDIASMVAKCNDRLRRKMYARELADATDQPASLWSQAINEATNSTTTKIKTPQSKMIDQELYKKYGFCERSNCYFSLDAEGGEKPWSNFVMQPLYHIIDEINPKRTFKITNTFNMTKIVEINQADLVSMKGFKVKIEGLGNFIWKGKEEQLTKLKEFLYECTQSASEIKQLGWQQEGFYAFGNGVFYQDTWFPADEYGIVSIENTNVYLPSASSIFKNNKQFYQFEKRFVHEGLNNITLRDYTTQLIEVFGDNAKVGICFLLATLFLDVVKNVTKNFPILNLFGPKGSGKSELGHSLMSFFIADNTPPNLQNATDAALAESVAKCANALVHLDEYKNTIELTRREFLKGIYDGTGRTRLNMDRDKKSETTAVDCGVIVSGQEMPTIDIALFSRMLYCSFDNTSFTIEAKKQFNKLSEMRKLGCSHLTLEILKYRKKFEEEFPANYKIVMNELAAQMPADTEERIYRNWIIPLAAFRTLMFSLDLPFDYKEMLNICIAFMTRQNKECGSNNELSIFWESVDFLHQNGDIYIDADYKIKYETSFKGKGMTAAIEYKKPKRILYLCMKRVVPLYKQNAKNIGEAPLPSSSLRHYLEVSKEYLGLKNSMRFRNFGNKLDTVTAVTDSNDKKTVLNTTRTDWALAFDYDAIINKYGIHLDVDPEEEDNPNPDIDDEDKTLPY